MIFPSEREQEFKDNRSSNAFANGSNQNCGNVITDRSSTRLHAPPGGQSTMGSLLSWDNSSERAQPARRNDMRQPAQTLGSPQQQGYAPQRQAPQQQGYAPQQQQGYAPQQQQGYAPQQQQGYAPQQQQGYAPSPMEASPNRRDRGQAFEEQTQAYRANLQQQDAYNNGLAGRSTSANAYADGSNQNCGNVLTDRRTTRVSAPPGGHSSICFG